jgi:hypothetical protein
MPMNASERFLKFAAECESMAKFTTSAENRSTWHRLAERWIRCAELSERQNSSAQAADSIKRYRKHEPSWVQ